MGLREFLAERLDANLRAARKFLPGERAISEANARAIFVHLMRTAETLAAVAKTVRALEQLPESAKGRETKLQLQEARKELDRLLRDL